MAKPSRLTPAHLRLIDALAEDLVADYLREQAQARQGDSAERPNHPPLPELDRAA